jgi:coenzyme F420 hydrogenase subunit beta
LGSYRTVLAARAGDNLPKGEVQGGGTVTALMTFAMQNGLIDAAALTDRQALTPIARLVTDWKKIGDYATSKFMSAPTLAALNLAARQGYRRIGVVGTPCQMTAVAQMCSNPFGKQEHIVPVSLTIGLFCNWSLDTRLLTNQLSEKLDPTSIRKMDIPPPPADSMVLETAGGRVAVALSDIKPLIPHTCFICLDMTSELADLAVGMFEGKPGWNTMIVRSQTGAQIVDQARDAGFIETADFPDTNLKHLSKAAADKKDRSLRTLLRRELVNNKNGRRAAVRIPPEVINNILK